jgi:ribonuclease HI
VTDKEYQVTDKERIAIDNTALLFTDGSVNNQTRGGFGAFLLVFEDQPVSPNNIQIQYFDNTSSTRLELQILLHALHSVENNAGILRVYTDSQNIINLPKRRARLEAQNFCSAKGAPLKNAELYKSFYVMSDKFNLNLIKIKGHKPNYQKAFVDRCFSFVDKAARQALKNSVVAT